MAPKRKIATIATTKDSSSSGSSGSAGAATASRSKAVKEDAGSENKALNPRAKKMKVEPQPQRGVCMCVLYVLNMQLAIAAVISPHILYYTS